MRLAFAISTAIDPDILLIDEILGAGDDAFMKKAADRMTDLIQRSKILVPGVPCSRICRKIL